MAPPRLDVVDHICEPGGSHGDDLWGRGGTAVWILTYRAYTDETLFAAAVSHELAPLYRELRSIEADDQRCVAFPRLKVCDDATAVFGRIEEHSD